MSKGDVRERIERASRKVIADLRSHIERGDGLCVIKAPPGSGKTYTLIQAVEHALGRSLRVAVATQTNAQADDMCRRFAADHPGLDVWRFAAHGYAMPDDLDGQVGWTSDQALLPRGSHCAIATTAKWSLVNIADPFDLLLVDEAWQMAWADFMLLQKVAGRFVLIGDPGQIPPVVTIDTHRWETSPRAPHWAAPELLLEDDSVGKLALDLPSCRRLPCDSVDLVRPFYDFEFDAWALPGERSVACPRPKRGEAVDKVIDKLAEGTAAIATLATPEGGPAMEEDQEVAALAAQLAVRALERGARASDGEVAGKLQASDIGISATHRAMNSAILGTLPPELADPERAIRVDTPERWQGLERKLMIVIHPLSGVLQPSSFDLETGRLCVMASRHRCGMIVVARDHVPETLDLLIPSADQPIGRPDVTGRGHWQNLRFWSALRGEGRVVSCG